MYVDASLPQEIYPEVNKKKKSELKESEVNGSLFT